MPDGNTFVELLAPTKLATGFQQTTEHAADMGGHSILEVAVPVLAPGTGTGGEALVLESAATRDGEYFTITGATFPMDSTAASVHVQCTSFLRFVRARVNGTVAGTPAAGVQLIGKR